MTKDELSSDYYPQFCKGAMYVLLANLLPKMLDLSRQVTRIGPDDAYVGLLQIRWEYLRWELKDCFG